jgi:hypothetical protein
MKLILAVRIADTAPRGAAGAEQDAPLRRNAAYAGIGPGSVEANIPEQSRIQVRRLAVVVDAATTLSDMLQLHCASCFD